MAQLVGRDFLAGRGAMSCVCVLQLLALAVVVAGRSDATFFALPVDVGPVCWWLNRMVVVGMMIVVGLFVVGMVGVGFLVLLTHGLTILLV